MIFLTQLNKSLTTVNIELSLPQLKFKTTNAKSTALVAGFGSGKTEIAMFRMIDTMIENPDCNMLYLAPTFPLIRDIWYPKIESHLDVLRIKYRVNKAENTIHIKGAGKIFCRTMEHPHRIIGFEVLDAFLDELDVLPKEKAKEVWRKTKARCRMKAVSGKTNQMFVTTTPEGFKATYEMFKKDPLPGSELIQMSTYSNEHNLPDDYIDELRANYPSQLIEAYINGQFVNLVSMPVWGGYDVEKNNSFEVPYRKDKLLVGMDFNVGRGCAVVYVERPSGLHAVGEVFNSYDTPDTIRALNEKFPGGDITVFPDASGGARKSVNATTSDIALLKHAGYNIKVNKKNPNIKDRVMATNAQFLNGLGERKLFVNSSLCPNFSDSLTQQIYDDNGLPKKGENEFDDMTDSGSYPIAYLHPIKKITTHLTSLKELI